MKEHAKRPCLDFLSEQKQKWRKKAWSGAYKAPPPPVVEAPEPRKKNRKKSGTGYSQLQQVADLDDFIEGLPAAYSSFTAIMYGKRSFEDFLECHKQSWREDRELYCICQTRWQDGVDYIGCDGCDGYFHLTCMKISKEKLSAMKSGGQWFCKQCSAPQPSRKTRSGRNCKSRYGWGGRRESRWINRW